MTGPSNSLVSVLLHHSGSRPSIVDATYGGFSRFAQAERRRSSSTIVELAQLDEPDESDYGPGYFEMDYEAGSLGGGGLSRLLGPPPGPTTLCDELGNWVTAVNALHAILPAGARPGAVTVVVLTDGPAGSGRRWTLDDVRRLIERQEAEFGWDFVFLGANTDAVETGAKMGFARNKSLTFDASSAGIESAFSAVSHYQVRKKDPLTGGITRFSDEDRRRACRRFAAVSRRR
ncbi:VWA domain-containing protein [Rhodococcoides kroppenstedtii]|uniref:VWA domain-containing protein n=1 Tax=Rhodococcoides kroppenstedtii TaxID=293050 RepID=UPI001BDEB94E|nr:VWA domain-containing protein [Rhodococcus kroppenstedtii]MBT1193362.1 VWA domain-containing protein [Rhodococcus kroppenstedtii]